MIILYLLLIIMGCVLINKGDKDEEYNSNMLIWGSGIAILGIILCMLEL